IFTDITDAHGPGVEAEMKAAGLDVLFSKSDAIDEAQMDALVERIVNDYGRLDVAVNVVGGPAPNDKSTGLIHETPIEGYRRTVELCLESAFVCMKSELKAMLAQGGGVIANTASLAGVRVTPNGSPAYSAAKAGVVHLTRKAAVDYAGKNIRVNVVAPGLTGTDLLISRWDPDELAKMVKRDHPNGRMVRPEEIADAFVWVCSDRASSISGHLIPVDGGWTAK
ncbi:MAG: SDR family oxidoreductase, partial [Lysobacter sp.]|nr:SDR family oxidoreductase [Lysobacter sp.]